MSYWDQINNSPNFHLYVEIALTLLVVIVYFITRKILSRLIKNHADKNDHSMSRMTYIIKLSNFGLSIVFLTILALVWEISFRGLSIYFASFFTIVGVAFFASWSIISNITAYAIIFFYFPFKIGSVIRIIDGDNSVEGIVDDITFFFIRIKLESGEKVTYPNNLAIQKPIKELSH